MAKRVVIHRDRTFEYKGMQYQVMDTAPSTQGLEGDARMIVRVNSDAPGDYDAVAEGFMYFSEIRDFLAQAVQNDWPSLAEDE